MKVTSVPGPTGLVHEVVLEAGRGVALMVVVEIDVTVVVEYDYRDLA